MPRERIHFVTGRLAEDALRRVLSELSAKADFDYTVDVLNISVAALMTVEWASRRIHVPEQTTRVVIPGLCAGGLESLEIDLGVPVARGPKDLRDLPESFGAPAARDDYGPYDIEILAEINHVDQMPLDALLKTASRLRADGADIIDLGCTPGRTWHGVADGVRALRDAGHRVSIDTFNIDEIVPATAAGAELVLSVNSSNRQAAKDWACEVVAIPDDPATLAGLDETIERLTADGVPFRLDPVLAPIGFGFAASLLRYHEVRRRYPEAEIIMGIGNLTELTDADSAGLNVLLLSICQEWGIRSVLTTQVINWSRTSVRECDLARRLVYHAHRHRTLPKHVEPRLVMLRDARLREFGPEALAELAAKLRDHNFRIFAEQGALHIMNGDAYLRGNDPFELFARMLSSQQRPLDAKHAFYLGYEMAKAVTALTLGKQYTQDEALDWGFLTRLEKGRHQPDTCGLPPARD